MIDSDAPLVGIEDIDPDLVKVSEGDADGEEEALQPVKSKIPRAEALLVGIRRLEDVEHGDRGGGREEEVKEIAMEDESVEETFKDRPDPNAPQRVARLQRELELVARRIHLREGNARLTAQEGRREETSPLSVWQPHSSPDVPRAPGVD